MSRSYDVSDAILRIPLVATELRPGGPGGGFTKSETRRQEVLDTIATGLGIYEALAKCEVKRATYEKWRQRHKDFALKASTLHQRNRKQKEIQFTGDFASFRARFLGNRSTWFQLKAVEALEECRQGEIVLLLWPPEHGKTSLIEDFCNYVLGHKDPQARVTVVSERKDHAVKVLRRIKNRMEHDGPCPEYVARFGPFAPRDEDRRKGVQQPWADDHFDVRHRGAFDERDFSMQAVGVNTGIAGARADWLIIDDCQSIKSLNQTSMIVEKLRQDFFSRPGMFGRICILGTRVGELDVYNDLIEEGLIDRLIVFPAYRDKLDGTVEWLWPERYTPDQYERMRKRVGEQAWARNYMQRPSAASDSTFNLKMVDPCKNDARSVIATCPQEGGRVTPVTLTLDPALGGANAIFALGNLPNRLCYLSSRVDHGLTRVEEIFDLLEQFVHTWNEPGISRVTELVIESMAFQRGLLEDDRLREMTDRFGIRVVPHLTGNNKYDEDMGVASMALSFMRGQIDLPYSDVVSRREVDALVAELLAWRPLKRGNKLKQDRVMALWFGWRRWRAMYRTSPRRSDTSQFRTDSSPLRRRIA